MFLLINEIFLSDTRYILKLYIIIVSIVMNKCCIKTTSNKALPNAENKISSEKKVQKIKPR